MPKEWVYEQKYREHYGKFRQVHILRPDFHIFFFCTYKIGRRRKTTSDNGRAHQNKLASLFLIKTFFLLEHLGSD